MKRRFYQSWMVLFFIGLLLLPGCGEKSKSVKTIQGDPEILYKQGLVLFNQREYTDALKKFEELKSNFPDSPPYTLWAELKVGDCHFFQKQYVEAVAAYEEFKKIHPTHEEILYVQYQIATAYFNQMLSLDRDQTSTKKALSNFEYLVSNYPPNLFTDKAKEKIGACKKRLADHEFYIANFYYKKGRFRAAALRFEELLNKFPRVPDEDKTLFFLGKSYLELDQGEEAQKTFTKITVEYPKSPYYKDAKVFLDRSVKEKKASSQKRKEKEAARKGVAAEAERTGAVLVKFEEEGKQPVSLRGEKSLKGEEAGERVASRTVTSQPVRPIPPSSSDEIMPKVEMKPAEEKQAAASPRLPVTSKKEEEGKQPVSLGEEKSLKGGEALEDVASRTVTSEPVRPIPPPSSDEIMPKVEMKPAEEKQAAASPSIPAPPKQRKEGKKETPLEIKESRVVDKGQPIDITSDKVEAYSKDNLIVFKGNVTARQKDVVIYADSLEAVVVEGGKGLEKAIAGGNVRIQMGLRVASCQKAVFYNLDQKVVLTGDPKVAEGDNVVSGDEIIYDIEQNRFEVKGGPGMRGKARIHPGEEHEKKK